MCSESDYSIKMRYLIVLACLFITVTEALATEVTFPGAEAEGYPKLGEVAGHLAFPTGEAKKQVPTVVILHGSGGIDGRGEFHAKALNAAGIATLEVFMFTSGNRPRSGSRSNFTHMYGALNYLAKRSDIDPNRIGVMGFSWGGGLSLSATSLVLTQRFTGAQFRFAAHAPFYPVCWPYLRLVSDPKNPATARLRNSQARLCSCSPGARTTMTSRIPARNSLLHFLRRRGAMFRSSTILKPPTDGTLRSGRKCSMTTRLGSVGEVRSV